MFLCGIGRFSTEGAKAERAPKLGAGGSPKGLDWGLDYFGGGGLDRSDLSNLNGGGVEIFSTRWGTGEAAEHCELASMGECVGYWALQETIYRGV
jgi:hypothetical protein